MFSGIRGSVYNKIGFVSMDESEMSFEAYQTPKHFTADYNIMTNRDTSVTLESYSQFSSISNYGMSIISRPPTSTEPGLPVFALAQNETCTTLLFYYLINKRHTDYCH